MMYVMLNCLFAVTMSVLGLILFVFDIFVILFSDVYDSVINCHHDQSLQNLAR